MLADALQVFCKAVNIPVNAIGGLNKTNCGILEGTGISGICVVSAIMKSDDPKKAASELQALCRGLIYSVKSKGV